MGHEGTGCFYGYENICSGDHYARGLVLALSRSYGKLPLSDGRNQHGARLRRTRCVFRAIFVFRLELLEFRYRRAPRALQVVFRSLYLIRCFIYTHYWERVNNIPITYYIIPHAFYILEIFHERYASQCLSSLWFTFSQTWPISSYWRKMKYLHPMPLQSWVYIIYTP